jgi:hypothetical protein
MKKILVHDGKILITTVLTVLAFRYAREMRGYDGIGGELAIPFHLWVLLYLTPKMAKEIKKAKGGNKNEIR